MKLAIVGWRKFNDFNIFCRKIEETLHLWNVEPKSIEVIISGGATGTDTLAERWAKSNEIFTKIFLPDWKQHGKAAGPIRNSLIIDESTHVIAFLSKESRGTYDSIKKAKQGNKILVVHNI